MASSPSPLSIEIQGRMCDAKFINGFPLGPIPPSTDLTALVLNSTTGQWEFRTYPLTFAAVTDSGLFFDVPGGTLNFATILQEAPTFVTPAESASKFSLKAGVYRLMVQLGTCTMVPNAVADLATFLNDAETLGSLFFPQGTTGTISSGAIIARVIKIPNDGDVVTFALTQLTGPVSVAKAFLSIQKLA